jgi:hypothetical protein
MLLGALAETSANTRELATMLPHLTLERISGGIHSLAQAGKIRKTGDTAHKRIASWCIAASYAFATSGSRTSYSVPIDINDYWIAKSPRMGQAQMCSPLRDAAAIVRGGE